MENLQTTVNALNTATFSKLDIAKTVEKLTSFSSGQGNTVTLPDGTKVPTVNVPAAVMLPDADIPVVPSNEIAILLSFYALFIVTGITKRAPLSFPITVKVA